MAKMSPARKNHDGIKKNNIICIRQNQGVNKTAQVILGVRSYKGACLCLHLQGDRQQRFACGVYAIPHRREMMSGDPAWFPTEAGVRHF
jgi:hypothetical protein